jgi:L-rhamnonate dehydratase
MKLAGIRCEYLSVEVAIPVRETKTNFGALLIVLESTEGAYGIGLAREREDQAAATRAFISNDIFPMLRDSDFGPAQLWSEFGVTFPSKLRSEYRSASGMLNCALSAVDQALWDLWGHTLETPLFRLLGGTSTTIPIYSTFGLNIYAQDEEVEAARRNVAAGFRILKLQGSDRSGRFKIRRDIERIAAVRDAVGPDIDLILDGRTNYELTEAVELAKQILPYGVLYFDEPVLAHDPVALSRFRERCGGMPVAARSRGGSIWDNRDLLTSGSVDYLGTNVVDQGGFTQSLKTAHMAEAFQVPIVTGGAWHLQNAPLISAVPNGYMTEYHALAAAVSETIFADAPVPADGHLELPESPGLGLVLNDDAVAEGIDRARARRVA